MDLKVHSELPSPANIDGVVFAVPHKDYAQINFKTWLSGNTPAVLDGNNVLTKEQRLEIKGLHCAMASIGRGEGL